MKANSPSATAERVAMRRAAHQVLDDPPVFNDPLALRIVGSAKAEALQAQTEPSERTPLSSYLRAFMAARSRFAEDQLALAVSNGTRQYVILGAGLDTFAYRSTDEAVRVFEVDHPATQAWKRQRLAEVGIAVPPHLTFAPVDFETQTLADGLRAAGFDTGLCTFFSWLGVTQYLTQEGVMATLRFIASMPAGSAVVFDYGISPSLLQPPQRAAFDALARRVAAAGEPWRTFFDPAGLEAELRALGFGQVEDTGPDALNARYFKDRTDGLRVGSLTHLMYARV